MLSSPGMLRGDADGNDCTQVRGTWPDGARPRPLARAALRRGALAALLGALLAGCPAPPSATRDGGTPCHNMTDCNPAGQTCGELQRCILGFCSEDTMVVACPAGMYPDGAVMTGQCLEWSDCNPSNACGEVISCVNFQCDRDGAPLEIPCEDGATDDASDDASDDTDDAPVDVSDDGGTPVDAGADL
jgi:hypothetical protein